MRTKFWINLTTEDISKLSRNTIIIVPFSAIEQHGAHLPLGTDKIILDKIIEKLCKKNSKSKDFVILPNLNIGSSSEHASFEGTLSVNSLNYINFCINYLENIFSKKFYKFVFINSHGGQTSHMEIVAKELTGKYGFSNVVTNINTYPIHIDACITYITCIHIEYTRYINVHKQQIYILIYNSIRHQLNLLNTFLPIYMLLKAYYA